MAEKKGFLIVVTQNDFHQIQVKMKEVVQPWLDRKKNIEILSVSEVLAPIPQKNEFILSRSYVYRRLNHAHKRWHTFGTATKFDVAYLQRIHIDSEKAFEICREPRIGDDKVFHCDSLISIREGEEWFYTTSYTYC